MLGCLRANRPTRFVSLHRGGARCLAARPGTNVTRSPTSVEVKTLFQQLIDLTNSPTMLNVITFSIPQNVFETLGKLQLLDFAVWPGWGVQ